MIVMGIDPGLATLGYGIVNYEYNHFNVIEYGAIITPSDMCLADRLREIYDEMGDLIDKYRPDAFAIEELFFNKNAKTAIVIGEARGVAIVAAAKKNVEVYEYTPLQVKQAVVGYGRAEKLQVQLMVKALLNLREVPKPDDVADALAVAICHCHSTGTYSNYNFGV
ncbi:Holliday junction endonuclease RuvC [Caldanaerobius fijiensis DSM 17918]|uniref:Crossover junction endodeoxyribonuclease RuvC n=1 Tax=Caldanaerobius fijiensis DSM 17918 TaxID=1121256 RepID=A0A1M4TWU0_9THEO|nr:crossover junction endodeoxyribonuclease RuvC [Caldanaerobius fijiensis]SHE48929.1 Holliday junction endonuclease RuvC [Caldanaerobius fijiensis DSM 17918]